MHFPTCRFSSPLPVIFTFKSFSQKHSYFSFLFLAIFYVILITFLKFCFITPDACSQQQFNSYIHVYWQFILQYESMYTGRDSSVGILALP